MKRKIFSILLTLVLVTGLSLIPAVPAVAAGPIGDPFFTTDNEGTVEWSTEQVNVGDYSAKLYIPPYDPLRLYDEARVVFNYDGDLSSITGVSYPSYVIGGNDGALYPMVVLAVDSTGDENVDSWVCQWGPYNHTPLENAWETISFDGDSPVHVAGARTGLPVDHYLPYTTEFTESDTLALLKGEPGWATVKVLEVKAFMGSFTNLIEEMTAYVDDVTINGVTYDLEPRVINTTQTEGFNTIQDAIDDADTAAGDNITVAAGTYSLTAPIVVDESVTITGDTTTPSNVVVNAPTTGIDKDAFQVKVSNVTIQGFNIKDAVSVASGNGRQNAGIMVGNDPVTTLMDDATAYDELSGININHNKIEDCSLGVYLYEVTSATVNDNEILRSTIENQGSAGTGIIWFAESEVSGVDGIEMKRNTITDSDRIGICFVSWAVRNDIANADIADNIITGTKYEGSGHDQDDDAALAFMWVDGSNFTVSGNTLADSLSYGVVVGTSTLEDWPDMDTSWCTGITFEYNNIQNNARGGMINRYSTGGDVTATNNWWNHASGPTASPGSGDPVSGNVLYCPWLLEPVVPGAPPPTTFDETQVLNVGWTLVSTDNWINPAATVGANVTIAYNYTPSLGWFEVTPAALVPVNALYLKTEDGGGLGITYSGGVPVVSSKDLEAGWNLISSATIIQASVVLSPLQVVQIGQMVGPGLATLVSQGAYNRNSGDFYLATLSSGDWTFLETIDLNPFDGYWVYMNAAKSFGVIPQ